MTGTYFINIDLDIAWDGDFSAIAPLLLELEPFAYVLNPGPQPFATLELNDQPKTPEEAILAYHHAIEALSPQARGVWNALSKRSLNIGIQAGERPHSAEFTLSQSAVAYAAAIGAQWIITVYGSNRSG